MSNPNPIYKYSTFDNPQGLDELDLIYIMTDATDKKREKDEFFAEVISRFILEEAPLLLPESLYSELMEIYNEEKDDELLAFMDLSIADFQARLKAKELECKASELFDFINNLLYINNNQNENEMNDTEKFVLLPKLMKRNQVLQKIKAALDAQNWPIIKPLFSDLYLLQ